MQKDVNLVDLVKSFPTNIYLQNLASIQKRTSPGKFNHLAEKSDKGSTSNLSTKAQPGRERRRLEPMAPGPDEPRGPRGRDPPRAPGVRGDRGPAERWRGPKLDLTPS